ncbi:PTS fructose transporter subunit IIC [Maledivibacter halophilus]|uniref:PTS system, fructose-specific IIC component n=1 Tax=Maledivibacter halophilus TaxID=36842 RepID=A0A1T5IB55_9FIRM|nr:PTS fructose transporter subunit IIC [Maledivibacter halophilus]SKC36401.1 PTS system, fructose-specific IIC component [Maledivibacter halophilus]
MNDGKKISTHLMTGVSYMIPVVTAGGLILAIATITGGEDIWEAQGTFAAFLRDLGQIGLGLIVPFIAGFIAYSIADKPGIAPGFICGMLADKMGTGFLGGLIVGLLVGYCVELIKKIEVPESVIPLMSLLIIPVVSTLGVGMLLNYVIGKPILVMTNGLNNWLGGLQGGNQVLLAAIIGAMMAFDMGGPVNKVAFTFGLAMYSQKIYGPSSAALLSISIPPLAMALASKLAPKKYTEEEREAAKTALVTGIGGITEGAIPFALRDPIRVIPSMMVGTALTTSLAAAFGVENPVILQTILSLPIVNKPFMQIIAIIVGVVVGALMVNLLKKEIDESELEV